MMAREILVFEQQLPNELEYPRKAGEHEEQPKGGKPHDRSKIAIREKVTEAL
jgi:hypothetical protein